MQFPWFPFYPSDWLSSNTVRTLTKAQKSAYIDLLSCAWKESTCSLPANPKHLKALVDWKEKDGDFSPVLKCFPIHETDKTRRVNKRLLVEFQKSVERLHHYSVRGKKGAEKRWEGKIQDRESKGFTKLGESIGSVADKHFPPV